VLSAAEVARFRTLVQPIESEQALCRPVVERRFEISVAFQQERGNISRACGKVRSARLRITRRASFLDTMLARALLDTIPTQSESPELPRRYPVSFVRLLVLKRRRAMLYTVAVILLVLWLLGFVSGYTIGAFIHVLLVIAIVLFLVGLLSGRRVV